MNTRKIAAIAAGSLVIIGGIGTASAASAHTVPPPSHPLRSACASASPWREHDMGFTGLTWNYVFPGTAREFHISRCSVVVSGQGQSVILTPSGRVVATS